MCKTSIYITQNSSSEELLNRILVNKINNLKFFSIKDNKINSIYVKLIRTYYTEELGCDIYLVVIKKHTNKENSKNLGVKKITTDVIIVDILGEKSCVLMSDIGELNSFEIIFS